MKVKVTMKQIRNNYYSIIGIPYCNAYYLLSFQDPNFYTCGVYGWNNDIYEISDFVAISTGCRNLGGNVKYDYEILENYENQAKNIMHSRIPLEDKRVKVNSLLNEFVQSVYENRC